MHGPCLAAANWFIAPYLHFHPESDALNWKKEVRRRVKEKAGLTHHLECQRLRQGTKRSQDLGVTGKDSHPRSPEDAEPVTQAHPATLLTYRVLPGNVWSHPEQTSSTEDRKCARLGAELSPQDNSPSLGVSCSSSAGLLPPSCCLVTEGSKHLKSDPPGLIWFRFAKE